MRQQAQVMDPDLAYYGNNYANFRQSSQSMMFYILLLHAETAALKFSMSTTRATLKACRKMTSTLEGKSTGTISLSPHRQRGSYTALDQCSS
jgi:hypothetical protein